jgi:hypothetical protein
MVNLGYMLPTDEEHENKISELARIEECSIEEMMRRLIDDRYNVYHPKN